MKGFKRVLKGFLAAALCLGVATSVGAEGLLLDGTGAEDILANGEPEIALYTEAPEIEQEESVYYNKISGVISEIEDYHETDGTISEVKKFILIQLEDEQPTSFLVTEDTFFATETEPKKGEKITGYYRADAPMIMIYPPRHNPEVVVVGTDDIVNIHVGRYNEQLMSDDGTLRLNIGERTQIFSPDGAEFDGEITNKKLVVYYGASTRSIPALTTPDKIVVLNEDESEQETGETIIDSQELFVNEGGVLMIPLRYTAEALGFEVLWDGDVRAVTLDNGYVTLTIDSTYYTYMQANSIELETAPVIVNGKTFVPADFWDKVMGFETALDNGNFIVKQ